eukprot:Blabericola_migrator_1__8729@NODE_45_length_16846_cov_82_345015_g41_i0_p19_GENE_NODE_45_length_16846_cov_82_345015_g41_i0NODE_45_length_16846_cov_82_345015_g41_i0_p19_ORF_typecomplete_len109_score8_22_NODE_45_length_16846_cov_82_345015_g41_i01124611572
MSLTERPVSSSIKSAEPATGRQDPGPFNRTAAGGFERYAGKRVHTARAHLKGVAMNDPPTSRNRSIFKYKTWHVCVLFCMKDPAARSECLSVMHDIISTLASFKPLSI